MIMTAALTQAALAGRDFGQVRRCRPNMLASLRSSPWRPGWLDGIGLNAPGVEPIYPE